MPDKLLFVDNDPLVLNVYQKEFHNKNNCETFVAESGYEGIRIIRDEGPYAVVVADYKMIDMDGIQFLSTIRRISPNTIRILTTGEKEHETIKNIVHDCNPFYVLIKSCPIETLKEVIEMAVKKYKVPSFLRD